MPAAGARGRPLAPPPNSVRASTLLDVSLYINRGAIPSMPEEGLQL